MGISIEMLVYEDKTSCTHRHVVLSSATVLYSNSYYTVLASIFLVSTASCKAICRMASIRLFSAILTKVTHPSNATRAN